MDRDRQFQVAVIGAGSAGYAAARSAVAKGLKTVVIEGGDELGGLCILRGCMPTKALLYAAEVLHLAKVSKLWGLEIPSPGFDFRRVMARKDAVIEDFAAFRRGQLGDGRFDFIREEARFQDPHTLRLSNGQRLQADHIVIATGSKVSKAPLSELDDVGYLDSDSALRLDQPPKSLVVLGGGAIALEWAQFFARFGTEVTVVQRSPQILRDFDSDVADEVQKALTREGMRVFTETRLTGAKRSVGGKRIHFKHAGQPKSVEAEEVLFALGRSPNTGSLDLDRAGVETVGDRILTDARMRTSVPHIYAAGDCTGPHEIVHIAIQQAETAVENIVNDGTSKQMDYRLLVSVVFTDPQVAMVGLSEKQARAKNIPAKWSTYPFIDHGKSIIMGAQEGFVKLIAHADTGEILGGSIVGPSGGELIQEIVVAMSKRMTVHELAVVPHYHPTLCEIWTYPVEELAEEIPLTQ